MKVKVGIVSDWRSFWKMHSLYVFGFIAAIPDIWNYLISSGALNDLPIGNHLNDIIKWTALAGAVVRLIKVQVALIQQQQAADQAE